MFIRSFVVAAGLFGIALAHAAAATFPTIQAQDLNGTKISLPAGLSADRTLVLIGFRHGDQSSIDEWISHLDPKTRNVAWLEISAIGPVNGMVRGIIRTAMKARLQSDAERSHMVTYFGDRAVLLDALEIRPDEVCVVVVDRSGEVLSRQEGRYDETHAASLLDAIGMRSRVTAAGTSKAAGQ